MAFTIPNEADASNADQAEPDKVDIDILVQALNGEGVVSGCAVTAQGSPDMTVAVAAGIVRIDRTLVVVTAGNVNIGAADGSNPRFDLITVNSSGTKACTAGTAAASPVFPAVPSDSVALASVYVPASDTTIASNQITDKRAILTSRYDKYDPDDPPATANALDDEFEGAGSIDGKWTAVNDGGNDQTTFPGYLLMPLPENTGTDNIAARGQLYQAAPAGTALATYVAKVALSVDTDQIGGEDGEFAQVAVYLYNSTNTQYVSVKLVVSDASQTSNVLMSAQSEQDTDTAFSSSQPLTIVPSEWVYLKLEKAGTAAYTSANTYNAYYSINGIIWQLLGSVSKTFTTNCDRVGIMVRFPKSQSGSPAGKALVDFFRRTV